jgi:predicted ATPase
MCDGAIFSEHAFLCGRGHVAAELSLGGEHTVEQRLAALEASLGLAGLEPDEAVPLIAPLLELPAGDQYPPLPMAPDQQRKRLLATVIAWAFGTAKAQPLVIATEDLHWADPSTLELVQLMVEQGAHARLLLLYTARPEFHARPAES